MSVICNCIHVGREWKSLQKAKKINVFKTNIRNAFLIFQVDFVKTTACESSSGPEHRILDINRWTLEPNINICGIWNMEA